MTQEFNFRTMFDGVAGLYEERIIRAFAPMAANLISWIEPQGHEHVLDIGTGTGIAARLIATEVQSVIGVDFSARMIAIAREMAVMNDHANVLFIQADAHHLPFTSESFDLVVASFGFNTTDPRQSLPEAYRMLVPGGRLCFQEWGALHEFDNIISEVFRQYSVDEDDAGEELLSFRDFFAVERPWYEDLQNEEDFVMDLTDYGFRDIWVKEYQPVKVQMTVEEFIQYKTAWTPARVELAAMDSSARGDCLDAMRRRFYEFADTDGILTYAPLLLRVHAVK
ncbi:MAG: methyltransferase domain-containing protein [Chloroflexi bacterium]|nr:methyltransferase domain-containing protein [Chloroflexota bacterium]